MLDVISKLPATFAIASVIFLLSLFLIVRIRNRKLSKELFNSCFKISIVCGVLCMIFLVINIIILGVIGY